VAFDYVPCGETLYTSINPSLTPEYQCVNLAYPVVRTLGTAGSATNLNECCPTTTTTTTIA
jgi:recombinational DNA repair protein (RecF pathway)